MTRTSIKEQVSRHWRIKYAEEELRTLDANVTSAWRSMRSTMDFAMACTGTEGQQQTAENHLSDMLGDVFGPERKRLLRALDEAGGDPTKFPWPLADETKVPA